MVWMISGSDDEEYELQKSIEEETKFLQLFEINSDIVEDIDEEAVRRNIAKLKK